jgi:hypothetical protein
VIAWRDFLNILAHGHYDAGTFMSEDNRLRYRIDLVPRDHIGMAHASRDDSDQSLVTMDRTEFDSFKDKRPALAANNSGPQFSVWYWTE